MHWYFLVLTDTILVPKSITYFAWINPGHQGTFRCVYVGCCCWLHVVNFTLTCKRSVDLKQRVSVLTEMNCSDVQQFTTELALFFFYRPLKQEGSDQKAKSSLYIIPDDSRAQTAKIRTRQSKVLLPANYGEVRVKRGSHQSRTQARLFSWIAG